MKVIMEKRDQFVKLPTKATKGSGAYDFYTPEAFVVPAHGDAVVSLGLRLQFSKRYALIEVERSSTAKKKCIAGAKFIDSDFRGYISVHLINLSNKSIIFELNDRVIQGAFIRVGNPRIKEGRVNSTKRGQGSFGSSGK